MVQMGDGKVANDARPPGPRTVRPYRYSPTTEDCIYMAAFLDAEGCINVSSRSDQGRRMPTLTPRLYIANTHFLTLEWIRDTFGGSIRLKSFNKKACYAWITSQYETLHILRAIVPYLKQKRQRAELLIELQEEIIRRNANSYYPLTENEVEWRMSIKKKISDFNQGGE